MATSVQNKKFLALLNRLDIDVKQFPDNTFDGLFDNVPEATNYFFNWFIENITPDNVLTQAEEAVYFQLESSQSLPLEQEVNYVLSSCNPDFKELMSLDINYVNNFLPQDLEDLTKNYKELSRIFTDLEINYSEIKKKQNNLREEITLRKKQLGVVKEQYHNMNSCFGSKIDEVKVQLLREPNFSLKIDSFHNLLGMEESLANKLKNMKLLQNETFNYSKLDEMAKVEDAATCVDASMILSQGFLREKKSKIEFLTGLTQKKSFQKSFSGDNLLQSYLINNAGIDSKITEEINILESEVIEKVKILSQCEIKKISNQYLLQKMDLNKCFMEKLNICKDFMNSNLKINSCLLHILLRCIASVEESQSLKKQMCSKLSEFERNISSSITNLELRRQRFAEVTMHQSVHPLLMALNGVMNIEENPENNEEAFKNIYELLLHAKDDSNFITHKFRIDLQSSIKMFFDNTLFGPTSQLQFAPSDLLIKLQNCEEHEGKLAQRVKRIATKYVEAKALISRSERKKLLSWIDVLINPQVLQAESDKSPEFTGDSNKTGTLARV